MAIELINLIDETLVNFSGSLYFVAIIILLFFIIGFLLAGLDFRFALLMVFPLVVYFSSEAVGIFGSPIISGVFWLVVIALGLFVAWSLIQERVYT